MFYLSFAKNFSRLRLHYVITHTCASPTGLSAYYTYTTVLHVDAHAAPSSLSSYRHELRLGIPTCCVYFISPVFRSIATFKFYICAGN